MTDQNKSLTLRERKKSQPKAVIFFSEEEKRTIVETIAKDLTAPQDKIYFYTAQALGLNPLLNEICAIPYAGKLSIQVMRDGFLTIAHRSGKFTGIESGVKGEGINLVGWAKVYHADFEQPVYQEADLKEYENPNNALWKTKPKTMIKKVAESMALRKAFNVSGVYAPEEMESEIAKETNKPIPQITNGDQPADEAQKKTIETLGGKPKKDLTRQEAANEIKELSTKK
jgi:phage recombination protein Bet